VFQKIDFLSSESSLTTYDGKLTVREEMVMTYKPKEEVAKAGAGEKE